MFVVFVYPSKTPLIISPEFTGQIEEITCTDLPHEVACLNIDPLRGDKDMDVSESGVRGPSFLCGVGLWTDNSARVLRLPKLEELHCEKLADGKRCDWLEFRRVLY